MNSISQELHVCFFGRGAGPRIRRQCQEYEALASVASVTAFSDIDFTAASETWWSFKGLQVSLKGVWG